VKSKKKWKMEKKRKESEKEFLGGTKEKKRSLSKFFKLAKVKKELKSRKKKRE
jgi:hypothetical protein